MKTRALRTVYVSGALLLATALAACGGDSGGDGELGLISEGTLTVCSDMPYPPFDIQEGDKFSGYDGEVVNEIAKGMDLDVVVKDSSFEGLQSGLALNSSQCDLVAAAMTITEEREENIDFTEGYYDSKQSLLVPEGSDIKSIEDLDGKSVGVQQATTGKAYAEENAPDGAKIVSFPSDAEMYPAIKAGQVDALLQDFPVNYSHQEEGGFTIVEEYDTGEQYGFAVREDGSEALLDEINKELDRLAEDGTLEELNKKYFPN
jgi:polar amino acid transport system substrate-binding protein